MTWKLVLLVSALLAALSGRYLMGVRAGRPTESGLDVRLPHRFWIACSVLSALGALVSFIVLFIGIMPRAD